MSRRNGGYQYKIVKWEENRNHFKNKFLVAPTKHLYLVTLQPFN